NYFSLLHTRLHHPRLTLFPYTTLFRSPTPTLLPKVATDCPLESISSTRRLITRPSQDLASWNLASFFANTVKQSDSARAEISPRSEEHTSELQSRENLVCRLLLEKKNT